LHAYFFVIDCQWKFPHGKNESGSIGFIVP
jgi:hypothetical protein